MMRLPIIKLKTKTKKKEEIIFVPFLDLNISSTKNIFDIFRVWDGQATSRGFCGAFGWGQHHLLPDLNVNKF